MDIQVFHMYNALADAGYTKHLTCPNCDQMYVTRESMDKDPVLACVWCNTTIQPGISLYSQVKAVVNEHSENHV